MSIASLAGIATYSSMLNKNTLDVKSARAAPNVLEI